VLPVSLFDSSYSITAKIIWPTTDPELALAVEVLFTIQKGTLTFWMWVAAAAVIAVVGVSFVSPVRCLTGVFSMVRRCCFIAAFSRGVADQIYCCLSHSFFIVGCFRLEGEILFCLDPCMKVGCYYFELLVICCYLVLLTTIVVTI